MTNDGWAVDAHGLHKVYRLSSTNSFEALRGVDLRLGHGEIVAIMGPSGSGKSTLLNVLGTLDRPTEGRILVDGIDTSALGDAGLADLRNRKIGFVFQNFSLISRMSARDNVALPLLPTGLGRAERDAKARVALERVGLSDKAANRPAEMSGGQQQRVAIARALVNDPAIVLADEPTGALDSKTSEDILDLLRDLNAALGTTVVLVTHDPLVARRARRIVQVQDGLVASDTGVAA